MSLATTGSIESNVELFGSFSLALKLNNKIHADKLPHNTFHTKLTSIFHVETLVMDSSYCLVIFFIGWISREYSVLSPTQAHRVGGESGHIFPIERQIL